MTDQTVTRDQFKYWKTVEVRWGDMDAQGHVNNAVYFTYLESARVELIRKTGYKGKQAGDTEGPALVTNSCDFKRHVVKHAAVNAGSLVERVGRRSIEISYGIFVHGTDQLVASARSVNAWANYAAEQAFELPHWFRAALAEYQKTE